MADSLQLAESWCLMCSHRFDASLVSLRRSPTMVDEAEATVDARLRHHYKMRFKVCTMPGCISEVKALGLCKAHYMKRRRSIGLVA